MELELFFLDFFAHHLSFFVTRSLIERAQWLSGKVLDSRLRDRGPGGGGGGGGGYSDIFTYTYARSIFWGSKF